MGEEKKSGELTLTNKKLALQKKEKGTRAAELTVANKLLAFQNKEKGKRAAELIVANKELGFQNKEKGKRAAELTVANKKLAFQNKEKGKRAAELIVANKELAFQNREKGKRAAELIVANRELAFQNKEKGKRAAELTIANKELVLQNEELEKRATELIDANSELKKAEAKIIKAGRLYSFISHINKTIINVKDEQSLFDSACKIAIEQGKFKMAWIGIGDTAEGKIKLVSGRGTTANDITLLSDKSYDINGPTEKVLQGKDYHVISDIQKEKKITWKKYAEERGFKSAISLPIKKFGKVIGTFDMYSSEISFFDSEEIRMLLEVAGDISFGLENIEKVKKQKEVEELVILNENRFRSLIEKSTDMKTLSTAEGEMIYGSPSITKVLGYSLEEFRHSIAFNLIHPDDIRGYSEKRNEILGTPGKSFFYQIRFLHKNGSWIWCEGTVTNMLQEPGIHAMVSNFRNISEEKKAEQQIEFDKNNLDALINNTKDLMWSVDREFRLITANKPFDEYIKLVTGKIIERGSSVLSKRFPAEQLKKYRRIYERAFSGEAFTELEYGDQPREYWLEISYNPIRLGDEVIGSACYSRDITESKKAQESLLKSEALLKEAQAFALTSNWEIDMVHDIHTWSDELYHIFGITKEEIQPSTESFLSFMHQDDVMAIREGIKVSFATLKASSYNFRFIRKDGKVRYGHVERKFELDKNNKPVRLFGIFQDVTEKKSIEAEREKITADLLQRNKDLEQFTYIVSHNLRAPVANIMGISEALRTMSLEEEEKEEMMYSLSASVLKLNGVIKDLNHILQTRRDVSEKREVVSFSHLIKNIKISIDDQIKQEQVEIKTDFSEVDRMLTLKSFLYSIFYNLISNSIKYRQADLLPVIEIKSFLVKDGVELHYSDNGLGIDMKRRGDQVFGMYKRFHTHKEGKGMGMFMVKTHVETLGGKISIESEVNKGTKFIIQFPL